MAKKEYILVVETFKRTENKPLQWWMDHADKETVVTTYDSFKDAARAMREAITKTAKKQKLNDDLDRLFGEYYEFEERDDDASRNIWKLGYLLDMLTRNPDFTFEQEDRLNFEEAERHHDYDYAFIGTPELLLAYYGNHIAKTNIHDMSDRNKQYYYHCHYIDEYDKDAIINGISVTLMPKGKSKSIAAGVPKIEHETILFGKWKQNADGMDMTDISWRVLQKNEKRMLLLSEKILDNVAFSTNNSSDWETSDIRKWLNGEFFEHAFSDEEKKRILTSVINKSIYDKVRLLSADEVDTFLHSVSDAAAFTTPYSGKGKEWQDSYWLLDGDKFGKISHATMVTVDEWLKWVPVEVEGGIRPVIYIKLDK